MNEKRFKSVIDEETMSIMPYLVSDNEEECFYNLQGCVDLLNKLVKDNEELGISIKLFEDDIKTKDKKIEEQQATIRKLQDLCGRSDYENAKLRIENKKLKDDLHNCRLNKNIIKEKLKMWQDVHKEHNIYSIKDFEKLMKKVK